MSCMNYDVWNMASINWLAYHMQYQWLDPCSWIIKFHILAHVFFSTKRYVVHDRKNLSKNPKSPVKRKANYCGEFHQWSIATYSQVICSSHASLSGIPCLFLYHDWEMMCIMSLWSKTGAPLWMECFYGRVLSRPGVGNLFRGGRVCWMTSQ